jgi:hypothetical protein
MILFITGPSGAGKSTLAAAWVKAQQRDIALIDPDQITSWIRNGDQRAPPPPWSKGWDRLDALDPIFIVLYPARDVCRQRRIARGSSPDDGSYDFDWPAWQAHPRAHFLDNSDLSVEESVAALDALLAEFLGDDGVW